MKTNLGVAAAFCIILVLTIDNFITNSFISNTIKIVVTVTFITYAIIVRIKARKNVTNYRK
ncbi:hypothetical protein N784_07965 [Pontibacillus litoralis JSM 072002]|uniref:Uncharacterized protein n=1 Tax=Pontibacillus litoralis JSM 072002 TaxID=1385512 RepID=A0A0A5G3X2_9BACI|nr:hypothetical protein N784_07965 [Pontibacillus litoralis JSM 072002]